MFILRQINKQGREFNLSLGENYSIIRSKDEEDFKQVLGKEQPEHTHIFAVVQFCNSKGNESSCPLYDSFDYYVMTETGKTFQAIHSTVFV